MKAILIIDMPVNCIECPCFYDYLYCQAKDGVDVLGEERPRECPLKPMPKKLTEEEYFKKDFYGMEDHCEAVIGYNNCIDEILGVE